jgi:general secretion pathway protein K
MKTKRNNQRGIALMVVMICIAITIVISNEFGTQTNVDIGAAANYRDQMRAHFLARSAQNLAELVVRIQQRLDNIKELRGQVQITDFADQLVLPFCGDAEQVRDMIGFSTDQIKGMGAEIGTCGFNGPFTTEDDKINLNCANVPQVAPVIKSVLDALVFFQAYDPVFEESDAEGWRRDRATQVDAIMDYVDNNAMRGSNRGTSEDYGYESLKDHYLPKNNYIDTVGEVKLVRGVDDRFWQLFGNAFTVYGGCKINLAAVTNPQLIASVLYLSAKNPNDPVLQDPRKLFLLASIVAKSKQFGETFAKPDDFVSFVKDPAAAVAALAASGGMAGSAATGALGAGLGLPPGTKIGMELDPKALNTIASFGPRRTYRIEAYGEIERKQKNAEGKPVFPPIRSTITGVWDTKVFPQNVRKQPVPKGAWVFSRED